ncbi:Nn.00g089800.m01.CDS01 [Neocucurbitaria sp. VM-36]
MGPAPVLADSYRKYKHGTNNFVQCLAETARATGRVNDVFKNDCPQQAIKTAGGRLKGKARKEVQKAGPTPAAATYQVPIKNFDRLAKAIANTKHVQVPRAVFTTLRSVIRGRKECANWYSLNADLEDNIVKEKNAGHQYYIKILEGVLDTLKIKLPQVNRTPLEADVSGPNHVANMFKHLELEECDESDDMPEITTPFVNKTVAYKLETSDENISFAIYCFLKDATHIRLFVRRTWREFKRNNIGLQAAALTMNAALAMIEKLSADFEEAYPQFTTTEELYMHGKILLFVYDGYCKNEGGPTFIEPAEAYNDPFTYKEGGQTLHPSTMMCAHTTELVVKAFFAKDHERNHLRLSKDEKRFLKSLSQLGAVPMGMTIPDQPYYNDMVHKAVWDMFTHHRIQTWAIFAIQIFWDTQRELGPKLEIAKQLLSKAAEVLMMSYQFYLDTKGLDEVGKSHKWNRDNVEG